MVPLETTTCGMCMFYKGRRVADGTSDLREIYGNALISTMKKSWGTRKRDDHMFLSATKRVSIKTMQRKENYILNPGWANAILKTD